MKKIIFCIAAILYFDILYSQTYSLDFGTNIGTIKCNTPYNGTIKYCSYDTFIPHPGTYGVNFICSNWYKDSYMQEKAQFELKNPGDTSIGSGTEVQFITDDHADLRLQASGFICRTNVKVSFKIKINKPSPLHWSYPSMMFYFGDKRSEYFSKTKTPSFYNQVYPEDTAIFGSLYFRSDGLLPNNYNAVDLMFGPTTYTQSIYPVIAPKLIVQGVTHSVDIFANTSSDSISYVSPYGTKTLYGHTYDVFIDGVQVLVSMNNLRYRGANISAFSWYVNQPNYFSPIIVDEVQWSSGIDIHTLPVELSRFTASVCGGEYTEACLSWRTEMELNNDKFIVQKSINGLDFTDVATVPGSGNSTTAHDYSYVDTKAVHGVSYYRLRQVDFDGGFSYSELRAVTVVHSGNECVIGNMNEEGGLSYGVYDLWGREVKSRYGVFESEKIHGLYVVVVFSENEIICRKKIWFI